MRCWSENLDFCSQVLSCACTGEAAVRVAGEFTWDRAAPASLVDIDLSVPAGALVAVVGQTGSGKSSLLSAALNLMQQLHGPDVVVRGKVRMLTCLRGLFHAHSARLPVETCIFQQILRCATAGGLLPDQVTV